MWPTENDTKLAEQCTTEKMVKYQRLAEEIRQVWKQPQVMIIPLILSATGVVLKSLTENLSKLGLSFDAMELPGQQLDASNAATPLEHVLNLDILAPPGCMRLTGIACFVGSSCSDIETMEKMIKAGMNIALINFSYGFVEEHIELVKMLRQAAKNIGLDKGRACPLGIGGLLAGKKIRTGKISQTYGDSIELKVGESIRLTTDETYKDRCSIYTIYIDYLDFASQIKKNDYILIDNEVILLRIEIISASTITCKIERGGVLGSYRDVFVPNKVLQMPNFSEKDKKDIEMAVRSQMDFLVANFVGNSKAIYELRALLGEKGKRISIVSNIQTFEGFMNFDEILSATDGVMVTRQELGTDITPKKLVIAQKNMIARANLANKSIWVNAHILASMKTQKLPLRSEVLDLANSILDGADVLVLSAETAVGNYPVDTIAVMSTACKEAEACVWNKQLFYELIDKTPLPCDAATGSALAAVLAAQRSIAAAIVVVTTTGKSAQMVSKYKPRCPIMAVTRYAPIARQLHMWRGVMPLLYEDSPTLDWQTDIEKRVRFCTKWAMDNGFIRIGDPVVIVSGWKQGTGFTNTMRIVYAAHADNPFANAEKAC